MVVNHNIPALTTYNTVNRTNSALEKSIQKLSTGLRINSAADDAAGLAISEKMRAQVNGMDRAVSNAQDGISMIQTAEGALNETHSILQRMRELAVQAANDTLTSQDRGYIQLEIDELRDEVTRIGNTTQFNKKKLLNGDAAVLWSSDDLETKAIVNGGLRSIDQFGQKVVTEGNYRIKARALSGQGEVQKSDIFRIKHDVSPWYATVDSTSGIAASDKQKAPEIKGGGTYTVTGDVLSADDGDQAASVTRASHVGGGGDFTYALSATDKLNDNYDLKFTVTKVDKENDTVQLTYTGTRIGKDGKAAKDPIEGTITLDATTKKSITLQAADGSDPAITLDLTKAAADDADKYKVGEEFVFNINASAIAEKDSLVTISGTPESGNMADHKYTINNAAMTNSTAEFKVSYVETDPKNPDVMQIQEGSVYLTTNKKFVDNAKDSTWVTYRKNVDIPEDKDPAWMTSNVTKVMSAELSENMPTGGYYTASTGDVASAAGAGKVTSLGDKALPDNTFRALAANPAEASGYLKLTVKTITLNTSDPVEPENHEIEFEGVFFGTGKDGKAYMGETATISGIKGDNTDVAVTVGAKLGSIRLTGAQIAALAEGQEFYYAIQGNDTADTSIHTTLNGAGANASQVLDSRRPDYVLDKSTAKATIVTPFSTEGANVDFSKLDWSKTSKDFGTMVIEAEGTFEDLKSKTPVVSFNWGAETTAKIKSSIGEVGGSNTRLYDLEKFWDSQGVFMLNEPQTLTLTQGDGKQATVTLYKDDTLGSMAEKINNAIANDLGQAKYVDDASKFATFVDKGTEADTSESVTGTMLIRTVVPGAQGVIRFSGDENIINALSLNTIQNAEESKYTVSIEDAHSGKTVVNQTQVTGNKLVGKLNPNVDVVFDATAGITAEWNNETKKYEMKFSDEANETVLHLTDNTTVFQIGANEGEDMGVHIGDMRAEALGLNRVLVTDRESASHSITLIDNAIDKVSTQRAKLGAYQNRLEHTINNLNTASENITAAESRIRDTDMAKEMMNFTKLQIMLQAGTSMLAQANQLPQNVMALVR
jgi:flagellin-like hook-associated protein FlgL